MVNPLEEIFPHLSGSGRRVTSPRDNRYNCIAWAVGDSRKWWWPQPDVKETFWPPDVSRTDTLSAFQEVFRSFGYAACDSEELEPGYEKLALFGDRSVVLHVARQLPSGRWTSKLGELEDIEHDLRDLEGDAYGTVVSFMKRPTGNHG